MTTNDPQPTYKDALGSFVDQSVRVAKLQRELDEARSELANIKTIARRFVSTWEDISEIWVDFPEIQTTYRTCAAELRGLVDPKEE